MKVHFRTSRLVHYDISMEVVSCRVVQKSINKYHWRIPILQKHNYTLLIPNKHYNVMWVSRDLTFFTFIFSQMMKKISIFLFVIIFIQVKKINWFVCWYEVIIWRKCPPSQCLMPGGLHKNSIFAHPRICTSYQYIKKNFIIYFNRTLPDTV